MNNFPTLPAAAAALSLSAAASVSAEAVFQYAVGSGDARSDLVIDFAGSGSTPGAAYAFSFFYDPAGELDGLDLLRAVDAGGDLDVATTEFQLRHGHRRLHLRAATTRAYERSADFTDGSFAYFVRGGSGQQFLPPDFQPTLRDYAEDGYAVAASGAEGRFLAAGSVDGYRFADGLGTEPAAFPTPVPEPGSVALLACGGGLLLRRRRA